MRFFTSTLLWILLTSSAQASSPVRPLPGPAVAIGTCSSLLNPGAVAHLVKTFTSQGLNQEQMLQKLKERIIVPYVEVTGKYNPKISPHLTQNCISAFMTGCYMHYDDFPLSFKNGVVPNDLICKNFSPDEGTWDPKWKEAPDTFTVQEWEKRKAATLNWQNVLLEELTFLKALVIKYLDFFTIAAVIALIAAAIAAIPPSGGTSLAGAIVSVVLILAVSYNSFTPSEKSRFDSIQSKYTAEIQTKKIEIDKTKHIFDIDNTRIAITQDGEDMEAKIITPHSCTKGHIVDGEFVDGGDC